MSEAVTETHEPSLEYLDLNLGASKVERYEQLRARVRALVEHETDWLANLGNAAAELFAWLPNLNWAGFYLMKGGELVLGPFQGRPACVRIKVGRGVCGTAVSSRTTQVVPDVHAFPGHIACDVRSRSEIVVPVVVGGAVVAVLDLDSAELGNFDDDDRAGLEALMADLAPHVDWAQASAI
ncbi:MAG: GAF domain-containing protein [Trueperaceae bacterium]